MRSISRTFSKIHLTEESIEYTLEKPDLYQEKSPIFDQTFQLDEYMNEFLKKLFEDVYKIPSEDWTYAVYTLIDIDGQRLFRTYSLKHFKKTVGYFTQNNTERL